MKKIVLSHEELTLLLGGIDLAEERADPKKPEPPITYEEFKTRLEQVDWLRYRKHWIDLTGAKITKEGKKRTFKLKTTGEDKVVAQAQNTHTVIDAVRDKILSARWVDLTRQVDEPLPAALRRSAASGKHESELIVTSMATAES